MLGFFRITCRRSSPNNRIQGKMENLTLRKLHSFRQKKRQHITEIPITSTTTTPITSRTRLSTYTTKIVTDTDQSLDSISTKTTPKHTQSTSPNETHNISLSPEQTSTNTTPLRRSDNTHHTTRDAPGRTKYPYHRLSKRNAGTGFNKIYLAFILIPLILLVIITFMACKKRSYVRVCRDDDNSIEMYEVSSESSEHDIYSADFQSQNL